VVAPGTAVPHDYMEPENEWERESLLDPAWEKQQKKVDNIFTFNKLTSDSHCMLLNCPLSLVMTWALYFQLPVTMQYHYRVVIVLRAKRCYWYSQYAYV